MTVYRWLFDHVAVRVDAEKAHKVGFTALRVGRPVLARVARRRRTTSGVSALGLTFPSPLGLAAGFDKNAEGIDALAALGFGFVEVGTVTAEPQPGNPTPRLFRLPADRAVVNRMGFNNDGAEVVARRLADRLAGPHADVVVGVNIGKTKVVPEDDEAAVLADYAKSTRLLAPYADYLVVNVSSPNTPGLRDLQSVDRLRPLLTEVRRVADRTGRRVPLLVKIAPDLSDDDVLAVADLAVELGLDGIVATNTTISREGLASSPAEVERVGAGGLSGAPLRARALEVLRLIRGRVGDDMVGRRGRRDRLGRRRPRAARGRGHAAPGLHRVHLRGRDLAAPRAARPGRGPGGGLMTTPGGAGSELRARVVQARGEVIGVKRAGAHHHLTLTAPGVPERFRPGTFLTLALGGPLSGRVLPRALPIHRVRPTGAYGGTAEVVFTATDEALAWLAAAPAGTPLALVGPLGRPFALPKEPVTCVLVGVGADAAPLFALAERLRERGCAVHVVLGGDTEAHLFGALEARRSTRGVTVATRDGSVGARGEVVDVLPELLARTAADVVYAAAPAAVLHAVAAAAEAHGAWSQTMLSPDDVPLPCGTGLCGGCTLPVVGEDGVTRMLRACTEGPVLRGDRVRWADLHGVPSDVRGAEQP